ncbi:MAG TPA: hypothetical protein VF974_05645 [Patescibacteria group bacterium]
MNKFYKFITLGFIILAFGFCETVFAAEIMIRSQTSSLEPADQLEIKVYLNSKDEDINAVAGKLVFSPDDLKFNEIRNGNSIVNLWIEAPRLVEKEIRFAGIMPGGYAQDGGYLFSAIFEVSKTAQQSGAVSIQSAQALLNDGKGTAAMLSLGSINYTVNQKFRPQMQVSSAVDLGPPEDFMPELGRDPKIFGGKWFLSFTSQDKGSGIDHYEVAEGKAAFRNAKSPYLITDQELNQPIRVKAVAKNGNERTVGVPAQGSGSLYNNSWIYVMIIVIMGLSILTFSRNK